MNPNKPHHSPDSSAYCGYKKVACFYPLYLIRMRQLLSVYKKCRYRKKWLTTKTQSRQVNFGHLNVMFDFQMTSFVGWLVVCHFSSCRAAILRWTREYWRGKYHCTVDLLFDCLESAVWLLLIFVFICKTGQSKPVKQEVNCTVILPPLVFPGWTLISRMAHHKKVTEFNSRQNQD